MIEIQKTKQIPSEDEFEIDLNEIWQCVKRNKIFISCIVGSSLFLMGIKALNTKDQWRGSFDILLSEQNQNDNLSMLRSAVSGNTNSSLFSMLGNQNVELKTQLEILKSPSVLMPIFNFVKEEKSKGEANLDSWQFKSWQKNFLKVKLIEGTSVLKLEYTDNDKDLVIPVLNKITKEYQKYTNKSKSRTLESNIKYLDKQIKIYEQKTIDSLIKAEEFSNKYDILTTGSIDSFAFGNPLSSNNQSKKINIEKGEVNSVNIELIRIAAANKIKQIDELKKQVLSIDLDSNEFVFIIQQIKGIDSELSKKLSDIELEIAKLKSVLKDDDETITFLEQQRSNLRYLTKQNILSFLEASKKSLIAIEQSSKRPTSILVEYKELLYEAAKNDKTLTTLKNQRTLYNLQKEKLDPPWEIITNPTLLPKPVGPSRKLFMIYALVGSSLVGLLLSIIKENQSGLVYGPNQIEKILGLKKLGYFTLEEKSAIRSIISLIAFNMKFDKKLDTLTILKAGKINQDILVFLKKEFNKLLTNLEITITEDLTKAKESKQQLIICSTGKITKKELNQFQNNLQLQDGKNIGLLLFNENNY